MNTLINPEKSYTYWTLLSFCAVKIPRLQRDYAQGRTGPEASRIRKEFLHSISDAFIHNKPLSLDFVYGSIKSSTTAHRSVLSLLDGQQRLTTLTLLHWYAALRANVLRRPDVQEILLRFIYEVRPSAADFFRALVQETIPLETKNLSTYIKDAAWYFRAWKHDPTIQGALEMIAAIEAKWPDVAELWEGLTREENPLLTFQVLPLENFGLTDDLYIRMNARGKALTPFENFKARLLQALKEKTRRRRKLQFGRSWQLSQKWKEKKSTQTHKQFSEYLDGIWTDTFWRMGQKETPDFQAADMDRQLLNFFRAAAVWQWAISTEESTASATDFLETGVDIPFSRYEELGVLNEAYAALIANTLDALSGGFEANLSTLLPGPEWLNGNDLFRDLREDRRQGFGYRSRIQLFALLRYVAKYGTAKTEGLQQWARVLRNLTEATEFNNVKEFTDGMKTVSSLVSTTPDILTHLAQLKSQKLSGFPQEQVAEEWLKAQLLQKDTGWDTLLYAAENHPYFDGQIGFLLAFSGIRAAEVPSSWNTVQDDNYQAEFRRYWTLLKAMFDGGGVRPHSDCLWERALLTKGDYLRKSGRNWSFLQNGKDRDLSWKRLLAETDRQDLVKALLDELISQPNDWQAGLRRVVETEVKKGVSQEWRTHFIRYPQMIQACGQRFGRWDDANEDDILLLSKSQTNGAHLECYTYSLATHLREVYSAEVTCLAQASVDDWKTISSINGQPLRVVYHAGEAEPYEMDEVRFSEEAEVINHLQKTGFLG